jgi:hypothetical protein
MRNPKERGRKKREGKKKNTLLQVQTSDEQFFAFMANIWFWF